MKPILICGAGIAGLSLAKLLSMRSIPFKIIEKTAQVTAEGAGIALPANAINLLDYMGLGTSVREKAYRVKSITYASPDAHLSTASLEAAPLNQNDFLALPRSELHAILLSSLNNNITLSTRLHSVTEKKMEMIAILEQNGNLIEEEFSAVIGADGIHSIIRDEVFPGHAVNDFGLTIWRWLSEWNVEAQMTEPFYMFDKDRVFMIYPISSSQVYCYAHVVNTEGVRYTHENSIEALNTLFSHCTHEIIKNMLRQLPDAPAIIIGKMESVETPEFSKGKICLIGDACHACTPMLQQGAALAFEDAVVLSELLTNFSVEDAFKFYSEFRREKVTNIVRSSNIPIRQLSSPDVDMDSIYENIRKNGPLNVQGWRKILSSPCLFEELRLFVNAKKRGKSTMHFGFASHECSSIALNESREVTYNFVVKISAPSVLKF